MILILWFLGQWSRAKAAAPGVSMGFRGSGGGRIVRFNAK
jgi:hypothetical protein